jgi:hypothetical protein
MRWMSDVANNFGLDWPYMTGGGNSNNGSRSWDDIGNSLQAVIDMPVKVSSQTITVYHAKKDSGSLNPTEVWILMTRVTK